MKRILLVALGVSLLGCQANDEDLNSYVANIKSKSYPVNDKIPEIKEIEIEPYIGAAKRKPFSIPKPETASGNPGAPSSCPQPNLSRQKQPLEYFSADNLFMRGTIELDKELWALVQVSGGELHRVKAGYYMGQNHGRILSVKKDQINLLELVPDGEGCWGERATQLTLVGEEE
ncbi:pilus assembly protein PilP [Motilimonas sp. E26]|uniref:pilus assembly protein PilP n=1 Tax=Motilimonas sp. E26 TaxID=2865674 RepID=UPI001E4A004B|nr:pilus assembly protein PilP [Motilimonas sp. E26]MCE0557183.1 pilus assembly protein PilP [Motilimonas sp. E26]